jgi:uroporphyrinogen decarboxylase
MHKKYIPDYTRIQNAASNKQGEYFPLYEHDINRVVIGRIKGIDLNALYNSRDPKKLKELFTHIANFHIEYGYDSYSFEGCFTEVVQGGKGLTGEGVSLIRNREDFENYPWDSLQEKYFNRFTVDFEAIKATLPDGMKITGGVGNGLFETVQDFIPFTDLAYLQIDDPELFIDIWKKVGESLLKIWEQFLGSYKDILALGRFGDDLGFKSASLLSPETIRKHIIPEYKKIVALIHQNGLPFLLHSCGCIFNVMDDIIDETQIDAKHSNEDAIAPFQRWIDDYGNRIGNFGGLDMDVICRETEENLRSYIRKTITSIKDIPGLAVGSGNQISDYIPPENFIIMVDELRKLRGI